MTTPTIEERVAQLEGTSRTHEAMLNLLLSIGERQQELLERQQETLDRHQALLDRHQALLDRHQALLERHEELLERYRETQERQEELLAEVRRDARQTQRLWVRLAQRYGWLDENDDTDQG